ncbi:ZNF548 isoform 8 [Pan troglodytes]|uniref:ZNF548 isoform 8 n=1 Tax=Pan troglodytes TaxID=9598 RepID=A0A2J8JLQ3_PANTR|nr:ZNF548 isoform 8 [Pan troglodytes]
MNLTENGVGEVSIKSRFPGEDHRLDFGHGDSQMSQDGYVTQTGGHKGGLCVERAGG